MRIGIDLDFIHHGGIGTYLRAFLKHLHEVDQKNTYIFFYSALRRSIPDIPGPDGRYKLKVVRYPRSSSHRPLGRAYLNRLLPWLAKRERLDLFHSPADLPCTGRTFQSVLTVHHLNPPRWMNRIDARYQETLRRRSENVNIVVAPSQSTRDDLRELLGSGCPQIRVIPLGVDLERFHQMDPGQAQVALDRYGVCLPFILFVAKLSPRKNLHTMLEALEILVHDQYSNLSLAVAGSIGNEEYFTSQKEWIRARGLDANVRFLGYVSEHELPKLMNRANAFVYPSHYEGFGCAAAEALACGCPTLVANNSSLPEVVGDAGITVDPESPSAWAEALSRIFQDENLRLTMTEKGTKRASQLTWRRCVRRTVEAYEEIGKK